MKKEHPTVKRCLIHKVSDSCLLDCPVCFPVVSVPWPHTLLEKGDDADMIIHNVGYHHSHDADFFIDRPSGSGDYLLLLLRTATIFTFRGGEQIAPENSVFLYRKGTPQQYRTLPKSTFSNDWIHFDFELGEEPRFATYGVPYDTIIPIDNLHFLSFCVKAIAYEHYSQNLYRQNSITNFMELMFAKIGESLHQPESETRDTRYEMLCTIRHKIYSRPYEWRNVESTAHEVRMSVSSFQHLYKKYFGTTFLQDYIDSRVAYAEMLLSTTNLSSAEIAGLCGYHSYAHFERQFHKKTGISPKAYRLQKKS